MQHPEDTQQLVSMQQQSRPMQQQPEPMQQQPVPMQQQHVPMQQQPVQMQQQPTAMQQQSVPMLAPQPSVTFLYTAQGTPVQVINVNPDDSYRKYQRGAAKKLGIAQIILGLLIIICQIVVTGMKAAAFEGMVGFWASAIFILAGSFGIRSAKPKSKGTVIVTMILSIIAAVFSTGVLSQGAVGAAISTDYHRNRHCEYNSDGYRQCSYHWTSKTYAAISFFGIMAVLGFIEGIIAIIASALCCHGCCCRSKPQLMVTPAMTTVSTGMPTAVAYQTNPGGYCQVPMATVDTPAYTQQHTGESTPPPQYQEKA